MLDVDTCEERGGTGIGPRFNYIDVRRFIGPDGEPLDPPVEERRSVKPGDRCLFCNGHGGVVRVGKLHRDATF